MEAFVAWFVLNGGSFDAEVMGITDIPDTGRGAIALRDIPSDHTLFTLPRTLTLSTRTSPLPTLFGLDAWRAHDLHKGWVGLILCMMWEDAWAIEGEFGGGRWGGEEGTKMRWAPYMRTLPLEFDTPMFWSIEELEELKGTEVADKIGREDAERAYRETLIPAIKTSPTLFPPSHHDKWYTPDAYHRAGSRILSRSFTVSRWDADGEDKDKDKGEGEEKHVEGEGDEEDVGEVDPCANTSLGSAMDVDDPHQEVNADLDSDGEDDEEDPSDVAMVPMADLLNARWGSENAKLFYEPLILRMVSTKPIKKGEQIFNTYGDPPNSDLLRRYGHVDLVRLPSRAGGDGDAQMDEFTTGTGLGTGTGMGKDAGDIRYLGNPSDVVEIRADLVVDVVRGFKSESVFEKEGGGKEKEGDMEERIEWWLDEGGDDTFTLPLPSPSEPLPPPLISLTRLLLLPAPEFRSAREKGKPPKGKLKRGDTGSTEMLKVLDEVLMRREGMYAGGSVEDDEYLFSSSLTRNKRHALIVRLGEKRILRAAREAVRGMIAESAGGKDTTEGGKTGGKRKGTSGRRVISGTEGERSSKKARR
ncbi:hypothetical protein HYDPIDRAFT_117671 [Hydnomerulius pinastri MD-312]|uniref:SET domain-containing protein n=1 Tax=Hydnomerulius pinastri MD-312 TaxID=994086 RepID=A0A0C9V3S3_9AGAM|nr:hypothetical protein HYDPIDRAFT_117671 [Hydnomerulius pinastri MD-312]